MTTNTFITRAEWNARPPTGPISTTSWSQRNAFFTHYSSASPTQTVRQIQDYQMDHNGWKDIGYNFLVDIHGNKYEGRNPRWTAIGAHAENNNERGIGVCFIGRNGDATPQAKHAIRSIYDEACERAGKSLERLGHRDVNPTTCPGDDLWNWVHAGMPYPSEISSTTGDDMKFVLVQEEGNPQLWMSCLMYRVPVIDPKQLNNILWQASTGGFWNGMVWQAGKVLVVPVGDLYTWGPDITPDEIVPIEITPEQLAAIEAAAEAGAAAGADGASPEEVQTIIDNELDEAFSAGADDDTETL